MALNPNSIETYSYHYRFGSNYGPGGDLNHVETV